MMKSKTTQLIRLILIFSIYFWIEPFSLAAESQYEIRADGLACPFCAYGIEKKFMKIDGVKKVDVDLSKGLVVVTGKENLVLKEAQLKTLFTDAGFTFRKIIKVAILK